MCAGYQVKPLDTETINHVYHQEMVYDFPAAELKPLSLIFELSELGEYLCLGLYQKETLCGYAYFCCSQDAPWMLLDYLSILRPFRNQGLGAVFLKLLQKDYSNLAQGIVLEVESPLHAADDTDRELRGRRIGFYLRNGLRKTNIISSLKKVDYQIMYLPLEEEGDVDDEILMKQVATLYRVMYPQPMYDEYFDYLCLKEDKESSNQ
ncbi:MAG: N-acetyltransferase [Bacillota bacterium]|nr:N-acetyltransferase [Bacillota bacterium]